MYIYRSVTARSQLGDAAAMFGPQVFAEGDEEEDDSSVADEPPVPVVKLRGKKVCTAPFTLEC